MIADRHVHTSFSTDSNEAPENVLEKAISLGMDEIYITDHYDIDYPGDGFRFEPERYFETLSGLKEKYKDRIKLHIGVEVSINENIKEQVSALIEGYPWEYVIGSTHIVEGEDPYLRDRFDMTDEEYYRLFFKTSLTGIRSCSGFDTFGHLDYAVRYGYEKDAAYKYGSFSDVLDEILKELIRRDIALEINTAALRKGLKYVHPYPDVLKKYKEFGGKKLAMGSDAHRAEDIGYMFNETLKYLQKFGFSEENFV